MLNRRSWKLVLVAGAVAAATTLGAPQAVEAQRRGGGGMDINTPFTGQRPFQLDFHAGFTWWGLGLATGVRFGIPIVHNGFIPSLNNAFYINFGFDFYWIRWYGGCRGGPPCTRDDYGAGFGIPIAAHWEFYFNETWSIFAELGFNFFFDPWFVYGYGNWGVYDWGHWWIAAVGGSWHISENFGLTVRLGTPYAAFSAVIYF